MTDLPGGLAATATAAAAQAADARAVAARTVPLSTDPAGHLLRRFTFGPVPADLADVKAHGLDAWFEAQLNPTAIADPTVDGLAAGYPLLKLSIAGVRGAVTNGAWDAMLQLGQFTLARQVWSRRQLAEVMVEFWSNHFNVACPSSDVWDNRHDYDRVIRAGALGKVSDLLRAVARTPAMLRYLSNALSDKKAVNENYGRELLELHTVGVAAGYTETDVRNSAYILTGRTVDASGSFVYDATRHWTGPVTVFGFTDPNATNGLAVGDAYLTYLATHPATARTIARKLAVRFVCDDPPASLVDRLAAAYLANGTAIVPVLRTLVRSVEFWAALGQKTRRPLENLVAAVRTLAITPGGATVKAVGDLYWATQQAGQAPLAWPPPNGYPDVDAAWQSTSAVLYAWNQHQALAAGYPTGLTYPKQLLPATTDGYVDALATRLLGQPLTGTARAATLTFYAATGNAPSSALTALLLDALPHGLR